MKRPSAPLPALVLAVLAVAHSITNKTTEGSLKNAEAESCDCIGNVVSGVTIIR